VRAVFLLNSQCRREAKYFRFEEEEKKRKNKRKKRKKRRR
jgi:hypothetical protein